MLELPELEVIRERLRLTLVGRRVNAVMLHQRQVLKSHEVDVDSLRSTHVSSISRCSLCLAFDFSSGLCFDLDFTRGGRVEPVQPGQTRLSSACLVLRVEDGSGICVADPNRPSRFAAWLARNRTALPHRAAPGLDPLGPDFTLSRFRALLGRRNRPLRHVLTDRRALAGIGSAFADEVLFESRLSPFQTTSELRPEDVIRLHSALRKVLGTAMIHYRTLPPDQLPDESNRTFLKVHRRQGSPCLICDTVIRLVCDGRLRTSYCPGCQTKGQVLSDRNVPATPASYR
jgi:formamidopyrimidine-DNA glycosylase